MWLFIIDYAKMYFNIFLNLDLVQSFNRLSGGFNIMYQNGWKLIDIFTHIENIW
jgi:hypothetical protein